MNKVIYIQLLNEGTVAYRPVPAFEINEDIFQLRGEDIFDPDDEEWEFLPSSIVRVQERLLEGEKVLVATCLATV